MSEIFRVYAANGRNHYAELGLPAGGYEMLDLMERLRLEPGQLPYVEILEFSEQYDYLEKCIQGPPDIFQLNALAKKLEELTSVRDRAAFEGLVGKELQKKAPIPLSRLIDFAYSTEGCALAEEAMTDFQLGKFLVDNDFIEEAIGLPESMTALLNFGKIGKEYREAEGGIFTGFGYVGQFPEVRNVSATMDFQSRKPPYMILLNIAKLPWVRELQKDDMLQLQLPAPESQLREALEKLGAKDWYNVAIAIWDSPILRLNHELYPSGEAPQLLELAHCLQTLDGLGQLPKYKAVLEISNCTELTQMIGLAGRLDEYLFEPRTGSPEAVAREELGVIVSSQDLKTLLPHIDLTGYGRALLERDQAVITEYGLLKREHSQQIQTMKAGGEGPAML